jgi:hypothetical protein
MDMDAAIAIVSSYGLYCLIIMHIKYSNQLLGVGLAQVE